MGWASCKTNGMRFVAKASLLLGLTVAGHMAKGDSINPLSSSFALTANAQSNNSPNVSNTHSQLQGSTINPFSVVVLASSTFTGFGENLLATAEGSATWTTPSVGQVTFANVGWSDSSGTGNANLNSNTGWIYTFTSNVTGSFVIDYTVTAQGTSSTLSNPLYGLNGFVLYEGAGLAPPANPTFVTGLNTSGTVSLALTFGQTYTVEIQNEANISGVIGDTKAHMNGTFIFGVQTESVPEPCSLGMATIAALVGATIMLNRWRARPSGTVGA